MRAVAIILLFMSSITAGAETAETIFINGNIYTVNENQPSAQAIAVKNDRIIFVGANADGEKFRVGKTHIVDLAGKTVMPGFSDSHCHIFGIGEREMTLNFEGTNTREDFLAKVKERVAQTERDKWITGRGWIETFWKPPQFPTRADLDKIAPDNPVFLTRADGHAAIANSAALRIAAIDKETKNPFGGEILRDKQTGEPTGMLLDHAQGLVSKNIPQPTEADRREAFVVGIKRELSLGWCEIQNAGSNLDDLPPIHQAFEAGQCQLRVYNAVYSPGPAGTALLHDGPTLNQYDHRFTQRTIKVVFRSEAFVVGIKRELSLGWCEIQNAGSNLDDLPPIHQAFEAGQCQLRVYNAVYSPGPAGAALLHDGPTLNQYDHRFTQRTIKVVFDGALGSLQPSHASSDLFFAPSRLGKERLAGAYAWQSLLKSGAIICGGSDAPVERGEPMIEFYAAVTRKSIKGESADGWHPEQALTREQALKIFTFNAAYAAFEEADKGSIELGKLADFTVLSKDIMEIPAPEILTTKCVMTVIGGEIVYEVGT